MAVLIHQVEPNSLCAYKQIVEGDMLLSINGHQINDFLDYQFYLTDPKLQLVVQRKAGGYTCCKIIKGQYDDIGLLFENYIMDHTRNCTNQCVFCFVDQMPKGMRASLYIKDDDARLSFLFGNYITLTNLTQREIDRIIAMRITPINISVHTTNETLRVQMMGNRFAGERLQYLKQLAAANIELNCQLVLCPGINDGAELERSLRELTALVPSVQSIACVPVGLTRYRSGLDTLSPYQQQEAAQVIVTVESCAANCLKQYGKRICYVSDEFYIRALQPIPTEDYYESFTQLENGVGMMALFEAEFLRACAETPADQTPRNLSLATGVDAAPFLSRLLAGIKHKWQNTNITVYTVVNRFFGETITVAGLLTGTDLIEQLHGCVCGDVLLLPDVMLRDKKGCFLDDLAVTDLEQALSIPIRICATEGATFLSDILAIGQSAGVE